MFLKRWKISEIQNIFRVTKQFARIKCTSCIFKHSDVHTVTHTSNLDCRIRAYVCIIYVHMYNLSFKQGEKKLILLPSTESNGSIVFRGEKNPPIAKIIVTNL
uniref:Uncharacterized protein n=1 Tax=Cacopsylla melanoneura TaxID=428564 RepID=A0A8D8ZCU8_9HEMI